MKWSYTETWELISNVSAPKLQLTTKKNLLSEKGLNTPNETFPSKLCNKNCDKSYVPKIRLWTGWASRVLTTWIQGLSMIKVEVFERCPTNKTGSLKAQNSKFFLPICFKSKSFPFNLRFNVPFAGELLCSFFKAKSWLLAKSVSSSSPTGNPKSIKHIALHNKAIKC